MDKIKTKLKFTKSERSGSWVGFVSINTKNGRVKGVREDAKRKKKGLRGKIRTFFNYRTKHPVRCGVDSDAKQGYGFYCNKGGAAFF